MRAVTLIAASVLACACTPHDDPTAAPTRQVDPAPTVVREVEPELPMPPIVAPALPELAPVRPLANLTPIWTHVSGTPASTVFAVGRAAVPMPPADAATLGLGPTSDLDKLENLRMPLEVAGPLLLLIGEDQFSALELGTEGIIWTSPKGRSYGQFVTPRMLVAQLYGPEFDRIVAWALADGREVWSRSGANDESFTRIRTLSSDGTRGYMINDEGFEVFDPHTGARLWGHPLESSECGFTSGEDKVVIETGAEYLILDADSGDEIGRIPHRGTQECNWESYETYATSPGVITNGRLYTFDDADEGYLRAFDLGSFAEVWQTKGLDTELLVVDHDAVYAKRDATILVALDAETGKHQTELSIGMGFTARVEPIGAAAGPLLVIEGHDRSTWILGRAEAPPAFEDYEIRGQLWSESLAPKDLAGVPVWVGGKEVKTDERGRFVVRGRARGTIQVHDRGYDESSEEWTWIDFEDRQVVLDGSGRYDLGKLEAWEASMS